MEAKRQTQEPQSWQERAQATGVDLLPPGLREGPPPQPPPPPPPPESQSGGSKRAQAALLAIVVAITYLWFKFYQSLLPELHKDEFGVTYVTTKAGNQVAVAEDSRGRTFFIDKAGNLYYDTGDVNIGAYLVDIKGSVYNLWVDKQDQPQRKYVGELSELQTMDIRSLAGIPVRELQREFGGRFDGQYTFFKSDEDFMLPPNAPVLTDEKDGSVEGPPILEEGAFRE